MQYYKNLQDLKSQIKKWLEKVQVDSYTCILRISREESINTSNLTNRCFEDISKSTALFQVFYNKKRYVFSMTGFNNIQEQIENIPTATASMEESEYYEEKGLFHTPLQTILENYSVPSSQLIPTTEKMFEKIKSLNTSTSRLVDDALEISNTFSTCLIFNKEGFEEFRSLCCAHIGISMVAEENNEKYTAYYNCKITANTDFLPLIDNANERISMYKQKTVIPIGKYKIIFYKEVAKELIDMIVEALRGDVIWKKKSFLMNKIKEKTFSEKINILENPQVKDSIYNGTVDMDGIKIEKKFLVKDGVVETMLLNREYAHKFDKDSTGNGWDFSIDYTNIYLEPGSLGFEELIQHMSTGIVVMEAIGPGFHSNNGEVSICIKGLYYENGIFKGTINGTLSGNIIHIMENVTIGNDISFESSLCSPSIQVEPMTFAPVSE